MKLVIFDCDGTLVDSQNAIVASIEGAFTALGLAVPSRAQMLGVIGLSLPEAFAALLPGYGAADLTELVTRYRTLFQQTGVGSSTGHASPLFPGAAEAVAALAGREGVVLGIATGKSRRGVARLIEREGWHGRFFTVQTADDHPSKPHPSMILRAMAEAGAGPAATVMVGDSTYDIEMARNAGVGAIGVAWGYHPAERLLLAGAHRLAATCAGLIATIDAQLAAQETCLAREEAGA